MHVPSGEIRTYPDRMTWLEARRTGIGGSDIAAIMGESSFTSPLEVFYAKQGTEREPTPGMDMGARLEAFILRTWAEDNGLEVGVTIDDSLMTIRSDGYPFLLHSPDALITSAIDGAVIEGVEVKNIRSDRNWDGAYRMPVRIYAQVQHGLLCSGLPLWTVVALVGGAKLITREVEPDIEFQNRMLRQADYFWHAHVLPNVPPAPVGTDADARALSAAWDASEGSVEVPGDLWTAYNDAVARMNTEKVEVDRLKQEIQQSLAEHDTGTVDGTPVVTWKHGTRNTIDSSRLRKELPEIAAKYTKTTDQRTFRVL